MAKYSATLRGKGKFRDEDGKVVKWVGGQIPFLRIDDAKPMNATFKLSGKNWVINTLQVDSAKTASTRLFDTNGAGGRDIRDLYLGDNSDVDLISTRVRNIHGDEGALHDIVLGSARTDFVNLAADQNNVTTGTGFLGTLEIAGAGNVTIGSGGAGRIVTDRFDDVITVGDGADVDAIRTGDGNDSVTLQGGATVGRVRSGNDASEVTVTDNAELGHLRMGNGDDTLTVSAGARVDSAHLRDGADTVVVDNAELRDLWLDGGSDEVTVQNGGKIFHVFGNADDKTLIVKGSSKINSLELGNGSSSLDVQDDSSLNTFTAYDGTYTVTIANGGIGAIDGWQSLFDISIAGDGWINAITLNGAVAGTQSIDVGGGYVGALQVRQSASTLLIGDGFVDFAKLGDLDDTVTISGTGGLRSLLTQDGNDTVNLGSNGSANFIGTGLGDDSITTGDSFVGVIDSGTWQLGVGETDDDAVTVGSGGSDFVKTGDGADTITTTTGWVQTIESGHGDDIVNVGSGGSNAIRTLNGNDTVTLASFVGRLSLGNDNDTLVLLENGGGMLRGDGGIDTIDFSAWSTGITFSLDVAGWQKPNAPGGDITDTTTDWGYIIESGFENVIGTDQADAITGDEGDNSFEGGGGADVFTFGGGMFAADPLAAGTDTVTDFEDGSDLLRLTNQAGGFGTLAIANQGGDLRITHDHGVILLTGLAGTVLTSDDFLFA